MTGGCFTYHDFSWGKHLRVDTSACHRCYAVLEGETVMVYQRGEEVFLFNM
jgi:predicted nuclease with RNAse H fold